MGQEDADMKRSTSIVRSLATIVALTALGPACAAATAPADAATVRAAWVRQDLEFTYMPITAIYTCYGFRDKMRWILEQLGARNLKVTPSGCTKIPKPEPFPGVKIVGDFAAPAAADARDTFAARSKEVEFRPNRIEGVQDTDCELMLQLRDKLFPKLGVKVVRDEMTCVPQRVTPEGLMITVEVLEPVAAQ
jgi:hypothetical protein